MISHHDLVEISSDPMRSHRILDGSGNLAGSDEISLRFAGHWRISGSPETNDLHPTTQTNEPITVMGQLRVEK